MSRYVVSQAIELRRLNVLGYEIANSVMTTTIKMGPMRQRLGNVIYWLGCTLAALTLLPIPLIFLDMNYGDVKERILFSLLFALTAAGWQRVPLRFN